MTLVVFDRSRLPSTPWKNGGGRTTEIVRIPHDAPLDAFDWRVSIAELSAHGTFSTFPGVDRTIALLDGDGAHLRSVDGRIDHRLTVAFAPFVFAGEETIIASLIGSASTDFNVMTRRGAVDAELTVIRTGVSLSECQAGVLYAVRGSWTATLCATDSRTTEHTLPINSGIWWDSVAIACSLTTHNVEAALLAVRITSNAVGLPVTGPPSHI